MAWENRNNPLLNLFHKTEVKHLIFNSIILNVWGPWLEWEMVSEALFTVWTKEMSHGSTDLESGSTHSMIEDSVDPIEIHRSHSSNDPE